ncbi:MAG TPA: phage holin family protein [Chthoniobacterales bacterium]|nr:phage holin family protein [Chthoniobacterales bacterium]
MAGENSPSRSRTHQTGFIGSLVALASALADFFESRAELFATESKAALVQFILVALCLVAALLFFAFGYVFLLATAVVAIAHLAKVSWLWIALAAAGLHLLIALIFLLIARNGIKRPLFRATTAELKKDREWLKNLETTNQTRS